MSKNLAIKKLLHFFLCQMLFTTVYIIEMIYYYEQILIVKLHTPILQQSSADSASSISSIEPTSEGIDHILPELENDQSLVNKCFLQNTSLLL